MRTSFGDEGAWLSAGNASMENRSGRRMASLKPKEERMLQPFTTP